MGDTTCKNCGSDKIREAKWEPATFICNECDWPQDREAPDAPLCSVCRRRHGPEVQHACE